MDGDDPEANFNLGALYYQNLGQPLLAVRYWERFLAVQPGDAEAPRIRQLVDSIGKQQPAPGRRP